MNTEDFNVSKIVPSKENIARLLDELNAGVCIGCGGRASRSDNTLCQNCWNDTEVFVEDENEE